MVKGVSRASAWNAFRAVPVLPRAPSRATFCAGLAFDLNVGVPTLWHPAFYPPKNLSTLLPRNSVDSAMLL